MSLDSSNDGNKMLKNIICFLTVKPSDLFYIFSTKLQDKNTDVYICIDDNNYNIPCYDGKINIIQIDNTICEQAGFKGCVGYFPNKAVSRDKALYYFCKNNIDYNYIWFIEADVFIPSISTIKNIDIKYPDNDILCEGCNEIEFDTWCWNDIVKEYMPSNMPIKHSMVCAIRLSKKYMNFVNKYVSENNTLFMDEIFFISIAIYYNLKIEIPIELSTILYRKKWNINDITKNYLYHPIKSIRLQYKYRAILKKLN